MLHRGKKRERYFQQKVSTIIQTLVITGHHSFRMVE